MFGQSKETSSNFQDQSNYTFITDLLKNVQKETPKVLINTNEMEIEKKNVVFAVFFALKEKQQRKEFINALLTSSIMPPSPQKNKKGEERTEPSNIRL